MSTTAIEFTVNGTKCSVDSSVPRDTSLNAYLRYHLALPGTKAMCHQGGCGACVVAVQGYNQTTGKVETFSVNSCLVLVFSCQGWEITTIEGLGNKKAGFHDIQKRTAAMSATQCGYCTAGWEMQLYSLLDKNLTMLEMEDSFGSNTCRCTGFRPILDTAKSFAVDASAELCDQVKDVEDLCACKNSKGICGRKESTCSDGSDWDVVEQLASSPKDTENNDIIELDFGVDQKKKFFKVFTEDQIFEVLKNVGVDSYMLLHGNTARGVLGILEELPDNVMDISGVKSLKQYEFDQNLLLGANMTIQDCITLFKELSKTRTDFAYLADFVKHKLLIAHIPVRKIGSLAGNLMIKHRKPDFESDLFVMFATVNATLTIKSMDGTKVELTLPEFLKYDMKGKLIVSIKLPPFGPTHVYRSYKIMPRSQNSTAIVNAGFLFVINSKHIVESASIVYGNISASFIHATRTEKYLVGKNIFSNVVVQGAIKLLLEELVPDNDPIKPSPECRKKMAIGLFYKFVLNISPKGFPSARLRSGGNLLERPLTGGKQEYPTDTSLYPVTQPVQKYEGLIQSSGEAIFTNDIPPMKNEVFGAFVLSTIHSGEIDSIDASEALAMEGVITMYTAEDIPGVNSFSYPGSELHAEEEEILASSKILFYGQPVAIIVANSEELVAIAATKVKVTYKNVSTSPPVLTIDEAKKDSKRLRSSDLKIEPKGRGTNITKVIKGVYESGAQYHYFIEPLSSVSVLTDGGITVYCTSQWPDLTHNVVARCLNIKQSDVIITVHRIGGGFGGKITRTGQVACASSLVTYLSKRPCRFILPMTTNMIIGGRRLPYQCEYEVGVDADGKIQYLDASVIDDQGCSPNDNVLSYTVRSFPNCYNPDNMSLKTASVLTDLASNTAMRGPGIAEAIASMEHIMEHIAFELKKDDIDVKLVNMREDDNDLPKLVESIKKKADYDKRVKEIQQFNKANRWMKKAIAITVMSYPVDYLGSYRVLINIYKGDGSVTVSTGGVEMGQGANTKVSQVVAYELGIPIDQVTVLPYMSHVGANNFFSGGSITSECICYAAIKACDILKERLKPVRESADQDASWLEIVQAAYTSRVDLAAEYMMSEAESDIANYSAFAVAILEGQLDVLLGKYMLNRVDILEDAGVSTNPAVDIGQIEGAYVQGIGLFTTEKMVYDKTTGETLSKDVLSYFVNLAKDIPVEMNIMLCENTKNPKGVLGSKAVGEMGMCTANGVSAVLRKCIMESRKDSGYDTSEWINIEIPYTTESILKALNVKPSEMALIK